MAVVTDVLDSGLKAQSYLGYDNGNGPLTQGDRIPADALGRLVCNSEGCTCDDGTCPEVGDFDSDSFDRIVTRMQAVYPEVTADRVRITYSGSGLGYAGDPTGMDISPTVTVSVVGMVFRPISTLALASISLPDFRTSLTMEDGVGTTSN
jgi:hypothetical protein